MPLRAEFTPHLADPSPESWREICRLLDDPRITASQHMLDVHRLADELAAWPPEIERPPLKHWHDSAHAADFACASRCARWICTATTSTRPPALPRFDSRDGAPAARGLERAFTALCGARRQGRTASASRGRGSSRLSASSGSILELRRSCNGRPKRPAPCAGVRKVAASRDDLSCAIHGTEWRRLRLPWRWR